MNKKLINEDIKNMKYLFGYKPGRVISEQEPPNNTGYWTRTTTMDSPISQDDKEEEQTSKSPSIQGLFPNPKEPKWTPEKISQEASKYKTKKDFRINSFNAYQQAYIKKMLSDLFPNPKEPKWTSEKIAQEASKYKTVGEFRKENFNVYQQASKKKMLNDLFPEPEKPKLTPEYVRQEASKYKGKKEFEDNNLRAYGFAWRNKMINDLFPNPKEPKWTPEKIAQEASKYKTGAEFRKKNFNVYLQASNKKMLGDLFPNDTKRMKWTPELVRQEASKYKSRNEFRLKSPSAYQYASKNGMLKKLSESNLTKIIRRVIKEQEERNPSECARKYVGFLFDESIMGEGSYGEKNEVINGGDLWYWNKNKLPEPDDLNAYKRFLKHCKSLADQGIMDDGEECDEVSFKELKPFLEQLYPEELAKRISIKNNIEPKTNDPFELSLKRRLSTIEDLVKKHVNQFQKESEFFSNRFEFADSVIDSVIDDIDANEQEYSKLHDYVKDNFGEYILSRYTGRDDEDFDF
jgi:hypothetical protein